MISGDAPGSCQEGSEKGGQIRGGETICGTSGGRTAGGQWRGFDLLINGGYPPLLLQMLHFNAGGFSVEVWSDKTEP